MAARRDKRAKQRRREETLELPSYRGRRHTVIGLFILALCALVWRAVDQQVLEKDFLQQVGKGQHLSEVRMPAHRGLITDRRGDVLALSTPVSSIAADPRKVQLDERQARELAKALGMTPGRLRNRLSRAADSRFTWLRRLMKPVDAAHVLDVAEQLGIDGIQVEREYKRYYPAGELFGQVIGFTNIDDEGQEGLELAYDKALRGEPGWKLVLRDGRRWAVDDVENIRTPRAGANLALSVDQRLQFIAYRELAAAIKRHSAKSGSLVLLDVRDGEVLAMVNQPAFNPNGDRSEFKGRVRNRAMTDVFEPGSTMKPFVIAAAMDDGLIDEHSVIDTSPGHFKVGGNAVRDRKNFGEIDIATILQRSSNVGAARISLGMDRRSLWQTYNLLGFGQSVHTGFPGEAAGQLNDFDRWARIDQATVSFGYGISVTALQLAQAYGALANDGVMMPATLMKREVEPEGRRVFSAATARKVRGMLESVVADGGTAPAAAVTGYRVAGKTGTAKKLGAKGYSDDRYLALFAGMAPAREPRAVMVVLLDEPQSKQFNGGQAAGPVFSAVMGETLRLLNVTPDAVLDADVRLAGAGGGQ